MLRYVALLHSESFLVLPCMKTTSDAMLRLLYHLKLSLCKAVRKTIQNATVQHYQCKQLQISHALLIAWLLVRSSDIASCKQCCCCCCRQEISDNSTQAFTAYGGPYRESVNPDDHGTSHLSVVDFQRGSVAMTTTINTGFGSKVISNSTGW